MPRAEAPDRSSDLTLRWSGRISLTPRILAVNIFALAFLAGGFFYLDTYRSRLLDGRVREAAREATLVAAALRRVPDGERAALLHELGRGTGARFRLYDAAGRPLADSWSGAPGSYGQRDPATLPPGSRAALLLDGFIDAVVWRRPLPPFAEPAADRAAAWPELVAVRTGGVAALARAAPDGTPIVSAAASLAPEAGVLLSTAGARQITTTVRAERLRLGIVLAVAVMASTLLSLFLARTIVRPLRRLVRAAVRVRLGRARDVQVPRLPTRRDEIGMLARALSDMSQGLNARIDATEAFAADVAHEIKNPLASLRSAVDALDHVDAPALRAQLLDIVRADVRRIDRLITDISDASRLDAQLARQPFEPVDLGALVGALVAERERRDGPGPIAFARPQRGATTVMGVPGRLERVVENLIGNALSFSPDGGLVRVAVTRSGGEVLLTVEDDGPGVAPDAREAIFRRFHSDRPDGEAFGTHSGLGLAIARTIVEGHDGRIAVEDRAGGARGARFVVRLPAADADDEEVE